MLREIIEQLGWHEHDATTIRDMFAETVEVSRDATPRNYAFIVREYGIEIAEGILSALTASKLHGAAATYLNAGIDLSHETTQAKLTAMAKWSPELAGVLGLLKERGITHDVRWNACGLEFMPTLDEITTALADVVSRREVVSFLNEVLNPLLADDSTTKAQIKAAVAGWE